VGLRLPDVGTVSRLYPAPSSMAATTVRLPRVEIRSSVAADTAAALGRTLRSPARRRNVTACSQDYRKRDEPRNPRAGKASAISQVSGLRSGSPEGVDESRLIVGLLEELHSELAKSRDEVAELRKEVIELKDRTRDPSVDWIQAEREKLAELQACARGSSSVPSQSTVQVFNEKERFRWGDGEAPSLSRLESPKQVLDACIAAGLEQFRSGYGPGPDGVAGTDCDTAGANLVLMRHGESMWNKENLFTGCVDVPLSRKGIQEAVEGGKRLAAIPVDIVFTSALARSQMTAMLAMSEHRGRKTPVVLYTGSDPRAVAWSKCESARTAKRLVPIVRAYQLNERMYGELQGYNKDKTADRYGDVVFQWRRSYEVPPPGGESLQMTAERVQSYFKRVIQPLMDSGHNVLISAHANSLRALMMYIEDLDADDIVSLKISTGVPMFYRYQGGKFERKPVPQTDNIPGVYAVSPELARYRSIMDTLHDGTYSS